MSASASINIKFNCEQETIHIIKKLLDFGWTINDNEKTTYLPLGDNDDFNWTSCNLNFNQLVNIINQKITHNELVGVVITWGDTNVGGSLLFWDKTSFSLNLNVNRMLVECQNNSSFTNVNWYIEKILPALNKEKIIVQNVSFEEYV